MMLIFGQTVCGRVDYVPGTCYVATRFFHLYYVPLIPLSSWVIKQGTENSTGFQGQQIRLNGKSVLCGWLQAFLVVFGLFTSIRGAFMLAGHLQMPNNATDGAFKLTLGLMCLAAWVLFTFRPFRAGQERADELRAHLGIKTETRDEPFEWQKT